MGTKKIIHRDHTENGRDDTVEVSVRLPGSQDQRQDIDHSDIRHILISQQKKSEGNACGD